MPEIAAEAIPTSDDTREELLASAEAQWPRSAAAAAPPDWPGSAFLSAYSRRVAVEDLAAAGPARLAETAAQHAALGAGRPQGRPVGGVRSGPGASLTGAGTGLDIVPDAMPSLVDSVTMELNRHHADIRLIVHPLLAVRRDVAGTALGAGE